MTAQNKLYWLVEHIFIEQNGKYCDDVDNDDDDDDDDVL